MSSTLSLLSRIRKRLPQSAKRWSLMAIFVVGWVVGSRSVVLDAEQPVHSPEAPIGAEEPLTEPAVYGEGVRSTGHRSPQEEMQGFHLPPDFEIRLFAAEPQIAKPLNMALDDRGRLWVTNTVAYPYPVANDEVGPDSIKILEDKDGDGFAESVVTFADGLNIPMGVLPFGDGCLCFSIPNIWYLKDTDGDGRSDEREIILGPFDTTRDTHGMINAMRDGGDGWIYACHGFSNRSQVAGRDGHEVSLVSGNTFRFRPDGSRIERVTKGQVNPFGMTSDEWGYWYSADCHSKPITQLIAGACYPSFGLPHDGLGFLPPMMETLHGSTAISGIQYFPPDSPNVPLRGSFLSGNVMTSRLNWTSRVFDGATAKGEANPDFLTSDDPWFRPVDLQVDGSGNIYVADFYNKIIGHYEVPLEHPGRDRTSGRIWQIRYMGPRVDAQHSSSEKQRLVSRIRRSTDVNSGEFTLSDLRELLAHENSHVVRSAAECLGQRGDVSDVNRLLSSLAEVDDEDVVLRQTIRIAIRDLLIRTPSSDPFWNAESDREVASIMLGINDEKVVTPILKHLKSLATSNVDQATSEALLGHAVSLARPKQLEACVDLARRLSDDDAERAFQWLGLLYEAGGTRAANVPTPIRNWALELIKAEWADLTSADQIPVAWFASGDQEWRSESRLISAAIPNVEHEEFAKLRSSFPLGETYVGTLASDWLLAPKRISFWIAGHNLPPGESNDDANVVQLRSASGGQVVHRVSVPRSDVAQHVVWNTGELKGELVRIEAVDGDAGNAYAWVALGQFDPAWLEPNESTSRWKRLLDWAEKIRPEGFDSVLRKRLANEQLGLLARLRLAKTLANLGGEAEYAALAAFTLRHDLSPQNIDAVLQAILDAGSNPAGVLAEVAKLLSARQQVQLAGHWLRGGANVETLLESIENGHLAKELLADADVEQLLSAGADDSLQARVEKLVSEINDDDAKLVAFSQKLESVRSQLGDPSLGKAVFAKHCQACHQLHSEGMLVGPQLDGAVTRSFERLMEDVLLPDRNIDQAFRTQSLLLDDGRVVVGLVAEESATILRVTTSDGKTQRVTADSVELQKESSRSLMPNNFDELMSVDDMANLMAYLKQPVAP
ncbi:PVC-type heme-binding CxxCH protein [Rhodopirellula halodulae]|uniref:PVC-type heme-binding CxxCH protein n=1 Tax=Rhodopirellula halodulae TaxID=2894198 RepID=UPI001E4BBEC9|nr:PVC-type heme-binding CxxCH protein [Rhodopirellula sp. JC737]MCC9658100.1 c-type cytochrome [Rhodopirellula sp. JC737]